jgi:hypothetical protein
MKIYINKPRDHWVSPYTICEKICFWREIDYDEPWVQQLNKILTPACELWQKFLDFVHPEIKHIKIDPWDSWSMDYTLSPIILPMLRQLQKTKHGAPFVDDEDAPAGLRSTTKSAQKAKKEVGDTDGNHFKRWDWVMEELIWTFEQLSDDDWEEQYFTGTTDWKWVPSDVDSEGKTLTWEMKKGPKDTYKWHKKNWINHNERIQNGLRLFGKYYRNLWD